MCFTTQDLALFSAASHDRNPLHISEEYARATPYGEPVVFGMLGALAALGQLPERNDRVLQSVSLEFRNPLAVGVSYCLEVSETSADHSLVKLYDVARLMITATFTFVPGHADVRAKKVQEASCLREAADRKRESFLVGDRVTGAYGPAAGKFEQAVERWGLSSRGATTIQIAAMMWASYVVGMEVPGRRAIFWRLMLDFKPAEGQQEGPLFYDVTIQNFDERFDLLHTTGNLSSTCGFRATAQMRAFVRQDSPLPSLHQITDLLPPSEQLRGKVALVIGGSRGLGAAITQALASQGCSVLVNYHQSKAEAEQIRASLRDKCDLIELVQGDAADVEWCRTFQQNILTRYGGLDVLVCNASPPIRPLSFVPEKLAQFQEFLANSVALVSLPMSSFLGALSERSGWNVVVSSAFVRDLPAEWPHYVTAKCAVEGLVHWAAAHHPKIHSLIVRPPKLLTDQTNTTLGRQGAMQVEQVAASLVRQLCHPAPSKTVQILETF
jgi:NAD(P)-dependent dehydrogenase (short-subunit alcohol dehydrogenase family)